jgi:TldD protein
MKKLAEQIRDEGLKRKVDFLDVRIVESESTNISLQDGKADKLFHGKSQGLGIRVLLDGVWGFAANNSVERHAALEALETAIAMAQASSARVKKRVELYQVDGIVDDVVTDVEIDPRSVPLEKKMKVLTSYEKAALEYARDKLVNTTVGYRDSFRREIVCNTFGTLISSESIRTNIGCSMTAQEGNVRQNGHEGYAKLGGYELIESLTPEKVTVEAAKVAVSLLSARRAPSGKFPVIFHPKTAGLLIHEALGHNAEADLVFGGKSILEGKLGQKIASDYVTVIDDATIENAWGSYKYDSEGIPGQRRIIIEKGVLKGFMHNLHTAAEFNTPPNGSARAQDYNYRPIVRMSNTFIEKGEKPFADMVKEMDIGILLKGGQWGYVFCDKGQYTCHVGEGWIIRNGEIAEHIRDVSIAGMILETLMNVDAVSQEFEMEHGGGTCGKNGQGMPASGGGPYVRVKELVVGGQESL